MLEVQAPRGHNVANLAGKRLRHLVKHWCNSPTWQKRMVTVTVSLLLSIAHVKLWKLLPNK